MKVNGLYEASGLALWMRTGVYSLGAGTDFNPGDVHVGALLTFVDNFFSKNTAMKAAILRGSAKKQKRKDRLVWPLEMICCCGSAADVSKSSFDTSLNLAGCHFVLWAWYIALMEAMKANATLMFSGGLGIF